MPTSPRINLPKEKLVSLLEASERKCDALAKEVAINKLYPRQRQKKHKMKKTQKESQVIRGIKRIEVPNIFRGTQRNPGRCGYSRKKEFFAYSPFRGPPKSNRKINCSNLCRIRPFQDISYARHLKICVYRLRRSIWYRRRWSRFRRVLRLSPFFRPRVPFLLYRHAVYDNVLSKGMDETVIFFSKASFERTKSPLDRAGITFLENDNFLAVSHPPSFFSVLTNAGTNANKNRR